VDWRIPPEDAGQRLDRWLAARLPERSRSWVARAIDGGRVTVGGVVATKAGHALRAGDTIVIAPSRDDDAPDAPAPEAIPLRVVHQDQHLVVVDKPAGLVVHPAAGHRTGTMVNALLHWARTEEVTLDVDDDERPGIVHRIDKDTSGLLVVALDDRTLRGLQTQFAAHTIERVYRAVVTGVIAADEGTRTSLLARDPGDRKRFASHATRGKRAVTHWRVLTRGHALTLLEVRLETGRTHQIRVHAAEMGHAIVADPIYGRVVKRARRDLRTTAVAREEAAVRAMPRLALHAAVLGFVHPVTGEALRFRSADPEDLATLVRCLPEARPDAAR